MWGSQSWGRCTSSVGLRSGAVHTSCPHHSGRPRLFSLTTLVYPLQEPQQQVLTGLPCSTSRDLNLALPRGYPDLSAWR